MEKLYECTLTGPAKIDGKSEPVGTTVKVTASVLKGLVKARAVPPEALDLLDADPEGQAADEQDFSCVSTEAFAEALQTIASLEERLQGTETAIAELRASFFAVAERTIVKNEPGAAPGSQAKPEPEATGVVSNADVSQPASSAKAEPAASEKDTKTAPKTGSKTSRAKTEKS